MRGALRVLTPILILAQCVCGLPFGRSGLPAQLTDDEYWTLGTALSEPAGVFTHSDNLVSNEIEFVNIVRLLSRTGGVYIGVGPVEDSEQAKTGPSSVR